MLFVHRIMVSNGFKNWLQDCGLYDSLTCCMGNRAKTARAQVQSPRQPKHLPKKTGFMHRVVF